MFISEKTSGENDKKHFAFDSILKKMALSTLKGKIAIVTILQELNEIRVMTINRNLNVVLIENGYGKEKERVRL